MTKKKSEYADAVAEMEQILALIESDGLSMDELSEKVKRVSVLLKSCKSKTV
jgi:Exonuclease VII small subunit.